MANLPTPTSIGSLDLDEVLDMLDNHQENVGNGATPGSPQPGPSHQCDPYEFVPESPKPGPSHRPDPPRKRKADKGALPPKKRSLVESR